MRELVETFPAVVLGGPRQVGKTSLLERTFPERALISLDVGENAEMAETRPEEFLRRHSPPVIIDEIQYAPGFLRHVRTEIDRRRGQQGLFILTGSQDFQLMEGVSESLAGRAAVVPLFGLSAAEWMDAFPGAHANARRAFLFQGGVPALWAQQPPPSRDRWYQGYVSTYLERDVRNLLNVGSLRDFERFLRAFYGDRMVRAAYVACTTKAESEIKAGIVARNGWANWELT